MEQTSRLVFMTGDWRPRLLQKLLSEPTGSASNSLSMMRDPDPASSVKGSSSNMPFWPGGLDLPEEDHHPTLSHDIDGLLAPPTCH